MRRYILTLSIFFFIGAAQGQQQFYHKEPFPAGTQPLTGEEWRLKLVERLMSLPSPVTNGAVQLSGMGDEAAVDVLKILSATPTLAPTSTPAVLDIVHMAFQHPESVINPVNQKPQAAMFLLQHLQRLGDDLAVKERITKEMSFLRSVAVPAVADRPVAKQ